MLTSHPNNEISFQTQIQSWIWKFHSNNLPNSTEPQKLWKKLRRCRIESLLNRLSIVKIGRDPKKKRKSIIEFIVEPSMVACTINQPNFRNSQEKNVRTEQISLPWTRPAIIASTLKSSCKNKKLHRPKRAFTVYNWLSPAEINHSHEVYALMNINNSMEQI